MMAVRYSENTTASKFAIQSYAALVLARQQKAPLGALREIWDRHAQAKSEALPLMQLGLALKLMGDAPRSQQALDLAIKTPRSETQSWLADYGSPLRDNAMMLSLLEEYKLLPNAQNTLLNVLSEQAYSQRWLSTQENNALFLAGRSVQKLTGEWQATTSFKEGNMRGDKPQVQNLNADQLAALQVTNTGTAPLWVRLDSSGYPQYAPQPASNVLKIERQILATDGSSKSLSSLKSGELVLVWLTVRASKNVPDALVVDLLPAGLELENQNLASSSASLQESGSEVQNLLNQMQQADIQHMEFRNDRFVAAVSVKNYETVTLVYLAVPSPREPTRCRYRWWNPCTYRSGGQRVRPAPANCRSVTCSAALCYAPAGCGWRERFFCYGALSWLPIACGRCRYTRSTLPAWWWMKRAFHCGDLPIATGSGAIRSPLKRFHPAILRR